MGRLPYSRLGNLLLIAILAAPDAAALRPLEAPSHRRICPSVWRQKTLSTSLSAARFLGPQRFPVARRRDVDRVATRTDRYVISPLVEETVRAVLLSWAAVLSHSWVSTLGLSLAMAAPHIWLYHDTYQRWMRREGSAGSTLDLWRRTLAAPILLSTVAAGLAVGGLSPLPMLLILLPLHDAASFLSTRLGGMPASLSPWWRRPQRRTPGKPLSAHSLNDPAVQQQLRRQFKLIVMDLHGTASEDHAVDRRVQPISPELKDEIVRWQRLGVTVAIDTSDDFGELTKVFLSAFQPGELRDVWLLSHRGAVIHRVGEDGIVREMYRDEIFSDDEAAHLSGALMLMVQDVLRRQFGGASSRFRMKFTPGDRAPIAFTVWRERSTGFDHHLRSAYLAVRDAMASDPRFRHLRVLTSGRSLHIQRGGKERGFRKMRELILQYNQKLVPEKSILLMGNGRSDLALYDAAGAATRVHVGPYYDRLPSSVIWLENGGPAAALQVLRIARQAWEPIKDDPWSRLGSFDLSLAWNLLGPDGFSAALALGFGLSSWDADGLWKVLLSALALVSVGVAISGESAPWGARSVLDSEVFDGIEVPPEWHVHVEDLHWEAANPNLVGFRVTVRSPSGRSGFVLRGFDRRTGRLLFYGAEMEPGTEWVETPRPLDAGGTRAGMPALFYFSLLAFRRVSERLHSEGQSFSVRGARVWQVSNLESILPLSLMVPPLTAELERTPTMRYVETTLRLLGLSRSGPVRAERATFIEIGELLRLRETLKEASDSELLERFPIIKEAGRRLSDLVVANFDLFFEVEALSGADAMKHISARSAPTATHDRRPALRAA